MTERLKIKPLHPELMADFLKKAPCNEIFENCLVMSKSFYPLCGLICIDDIALLPQIILLSSLWGHIYYSMLVVVKPKLCLSFGPVVKGFLMGLPFKRKDFLGKFLEISENNKANHLQ